MEYLVLALRVADRRVLDRRLDERVDGMLQRGLVEEVGTLREQLRSTPVLGDGGLRRGLQWGTQQAPHGVDAPSDLTVRLVAEQAAEMVVNRRVVPPSDSGDSDEAAAKATALVRQYDGVLQAIGFKEFDAYFAMRDKLQAQTVLSDSALSATTFATSTSSSEVSVASVQRTLQSAIAAVRTATHRYARHQEHWIRNRFERRGVPLLALETGVGGEDWVNLVLLPAVRAARLWLTDGVRPTTDSASRSRLEEPATADGGDAVGASTTAAGAPHAALSSGAHTGGSGDGGNAAMLPDDATRIFTWRKHHCDACARTLNGDFEWERHLKSRGHSRTIANARLRERLVTERGIELPPPRQRRRVDPLQTSGSLDARLSAEPDVNVVSRSPPVAELLPAQVASVADSIIVDAVVPQ